MILVLRITSHRKYILGLNLVLQSIVIIVSNFLYNFIVQCVTGLIDEFMLPTALILESRINPDKTYKDTHA